LLRWSLLRTMAATPDGGISPRTALLRLVGDDEPSMLEEELQRRGLGPSYTLDAAGNSLLHVAITYGAFSTLQWLLAAKADPNSPDAHGMTPLHFASTDGAVDAVRALLHASADVHVYSEDRLVRLGRMPMYVCGGRTPLHVASTAEGIRLLLAAAADADARDFDGNTAWDVALRDGSKPRADLAAVLRPGAEIPDMAIIEEARRADNRARATRLTLKDTCQRFLDESDSLGSVSGDQGSFGDREGELAATHLKDVGAGCRDGLGASDGFRSLPSALSTLLAPMPELSSDAPWCFVPVNAVPAFQHLKIDEGPNQHRAFRGAHLWRPQANTLAAATAPFAGDCVLHSKAALQAVAGTNVPPSLALPEGVYAWCYCGHQLGKFSGQLGDGAALCARLAREPSHTNWELSWKGAGRTPFSRDGTTGRKSMGSCVRELLLSETLSAMGIPCTRGLAVFASTSFFERSKLAALAAKGPAGHLESMVAGFPVLIVGKAWCSNCKAAKAIFTDLGASYEVLELEDADKRPLVKNPEAYQDLLEATTGVRSVPCVFLSAKYLGGRDDIEALQRTDKLRDLLGEAGALGISGAVSTSRRSPGLPEERDNAGALLVRACPGVGMVRFGTFDIANGPELDPRNGRAGPSTGDYQMVASLVAFAGGTGGAAGLLLNACRQSALLAARWAALGIVHGMLNTDNMHIEGAMIDVTSAEFMAVYNPLNDASGPAAARGRYCYRQQAAAVHWGLKRLAAALSRGAGQLPEDEASAIVAQFPRMYSIAWLREMRAKLGLAQATEGGVKQARADRALLRHLFKTMEDTFSDFTATFHCLLPPRPLNGQEMLERLAACAAPPPSAAVRAEELHKLAVRIRPVEPMDLLDHLAGSAEQVSAGREASAHIRRRLARRLARHGEADRLEEAAAAAGSLDPSALRAADAEAWTSWLQTYAERCSLLEGGGADGAMMARANPKFVPRPWVIDAAAVAAERGDFAPARRLLDLLPHAFDHTSDFAELARSVPPDS